ncbi:MAG: hypothetical protein JKY61_08240 [Planctomycetes bacterium]|nr:hypothetical protein [Planctomycetota bacterium]
MSEETEDPKSETRESRKQAAAAPAKRELEQAPLMLRKASWILVIGALFPFFSALRYASAAVNKVGDLTNAFDWKTWAIVKVLVVAGGWVAYECSLARSGDKPKSVLMGLAKAHAKAGIGVAGLFWIGAIVLLFMGAGVYVEVSPGKTAEVFQLGMIAEILTLMLGMYAIEHIHGYEHGGKFNPLVPLLMVGPGIAGVLNLLSSIAAFRNPYSGLGAVGLIGSVIVAAGGIFAIKIMIDSMKEAKVQGEIKKAAMREARKAEREAKRASR